MSILTIKQLYDLGYFSGLDYHFARTLGQLAGEEDPLVMLAAGAVSRFTAQGHVCFEMKRLAGKPVVSDDGEVLGDGVWPELESWLGALEKSPLVGKRDASFPLVTDEGGRLYLARYWQYQQRLLGQLTQRSPGAAAGVDRAVLSKGLARLFPEGEDGYDGQRTAAETSVLRHLTVVSGGPGTGKTYTVVKMLQLIIEQALAAGEEAPRILLAAPTGKAAARLKESIAAAKGAAAGGDTRVMDAIPENAATVHRMLGMGPGGKGTVPMAPGDVVVVDEASMVDLSLMTRLMEAVPEHARLILLGDKDQLASVEAGAILGDICRGGAPDGEGGAVSAISGSVVTLSRSYRFDSGGGIGALAGAIRDGESRRAIAILQDAAYPDVVFRPLSRPDALSGMLREISRKAYLPYFKAPDPSRRMAVFNAFRILCAHRQGPVGVDAVNAAVEAFLLSEVGMAPERHWYPGRPIMVTRNDYQMGLFNGDIGMVNPGDDGDNLKVYFEEQGEQRWIPLSRMPAHATVYAMTVHKSQGSEFDRIVVILPPHRSPVVTRELLYTAVTRAKKSVDIIAPERVIREAVETPVQRASGLSEQLFAVSSE